MKIYVFGNPLVKEDAVPLLMLPDLKSHFPKLDFITVDPNENFPPEGEKNIIVIDTVKGIDKVTLLDFTDLAQVDKSPISPHDYDLLLHLLLLKKMGKIDMVKIIALPMLQSPVFKKELLKEISKHINALFLTGSVGNGVIST